MKRKRKNKLVIKKPKKIDINELEFLKKQIKRKCIHPIQKNYNIWFSEEKKKSKGKIANSLKFAFDASENLIQETQKVKKFDEYISKLSEFYLKIMENTDEKYHNKIGDFLLKERINCKYKYNWHHKKNTFTLFWKQLGEILSGEKQKPKEIEWKQRKKRNMRYF